ncbi:MAG TPA: methyltransferase [Baekduia sp.]|nr:methyltransferase [Baekduia sp.]
MSNKAAATAASPGRIFEVGYGFAACSALLSAIELDVFTELAKEPASLDDLTRRVGIHPRSALDFFDVLVTLGFLERDDDGVYSNSMDTDYYLDRNKATFVGSIFSQVTNNHFPMSVNLTKGIRTGEVQIDRQKTEDDLFDFYEDPKQLDGFLQGQNEWNEPSSKALPTAFEFEKYQTVADIGCAGGGLLREVLAAHPHLQGIGFDLPPVGPQFDVYIEQHGLADRAKFIGGDFFKDPLPTADVLTFGHILHDWNPEIRKRLLHMAYETLAPGGVVIVIDAIVDSERRNAPLPLLLSLGMSLVTPHGGEYTDRDCEEWMRDAGFSEIRVEHLIGFDSMVVGVK